MTSKSEESGVDRTPVPARLRLRDDRNQYKNRAEGEPMPVGGESSTPPQLRSSPRSVFPPATVIPWRVKNKQRRLSRVRKRPAGAMSTIVRL